jgi:EAL domain-containing protein (putative c-di-GMP-specific phosphodiesterase class I)
MMVSIVRAVIAMAHGMNIKVVAEGIENQWQYGFLKKEGCDIGQVLYFQTYLVLINYRERVSA